MSTYIVEWGNCKAATRNRMTTVMGKMSMPTAKSAALLAQNLLHTLTNGGPDKPDVDFYLRAPGNVHATGWTNNGLSFVSVRIAELTDEPSALTSYRSPVSYCSLAAHQVGYGTDAQQAEHYADFQSRHSVEQLQAIVQAKRDSVE